MPAPRTVVIEGNDAQGYTAWAPELDGVSAMGSTVDQAEHVMRTRLRELGEKPGIVRVEIAS